MEYWDLLDAFHRPTGERHVRGRKMPQGRFHQVVHLCIFNSLGQLLIQQRQSTKSGWPNLWDISVGGSCIEGESSRQGIQRELSEELGMTYDFTNTAPVITINGQTFFDDYYVIQANPSLEQLSLQEEEVQAVDWGDLGRIFEMQKEGRFIPYDNAFLEYLFHLGTGKAENSLRVSRHRQ